MKAKYVEFPFTTARARAEAAKDRAAARRRRYQAKTKQCRRGHFFLATSPDSVCPTCYRT